jgi:hypothetical protein
MRWSGRGRVRACAEALARSSRRLRRLLIEGVNTATYAELAPAIGADLPLLRALFARGHHLVDEVPLAVLIRSSLGAQSDPWIGPITRRLAALSAPEAELTPLLPDLCERCAMKIAHIDRAIAELPGDAEIEREELEDLRSVYERTLQHASPLMVH